MYFRSDLVDLCDVCNTQYIVLGSLFFRASATAHRAFRVDMAILESKRNHILFSLNYKHRQDEARS